MSKIDDGGSAFPGTQYASGISPSGHSVGMSLRDYFAAKAMESFINNSSGVSFGVSHSENNLNYARASYSLADAMLAAREAGNPEQQHPPGWVEWNGGECPVPNGASFFIRFRDGYECDAGTGDGLVWDHYGNDSDIIAYFTYNNGDQK